MLLRKPETSFKVSYAISLVLSHGITDMICDLDTRTPDIPRLSAEKSLINKALPDSTKPRLATDTWARIPTRSRDSGSELDSETVTGA